MPLSIAKSPTELTLVSETECEHGECYHIRFFIEDLSGAEYFTQEDGKITWKQIGKLILLKSDFLALEKKYIQLTNEEIYTQLRKLTVAETISSHIH
jgi:hypothetical protein